jgi:hypothetical protein
MTMSESIDRSGRSADEVALINALSAVASAGSGAASRPGQLMARLEAELGEAAGRNRGRVRQLVAGAEEHVPARLAGLAPLTPAAMDRVASELAQVRGWTMEVASWVVASWATALGLASVAQRPAMSIAPGVPMSDPSLAGVRIPSGDVTALAQPPRASVRAPVVPPPTPPPGPPVPAPAMPGHSLEGMPSPQEESARCRGQAAGFPPARGQSKAFTGPSLVPVLVIAGLVTVVAAAGLVVVAAPLGRLLICAGLVAMVVVLSRLWRHGIVLAYDDGVIVVITKGRRGAVRPETRQDFDWDYVTVRDGYVPQLTVHGRTWQLPPAARAFVRAAGEHGDAVRDGAAGFPVFPPNGTPGL